MIDVGLDLGPAANVARASQPEKACTKVQPYRSKNQRIACEQASYAF